MTVAASNGISPKFTIENPVRQSVKAVRQLKGAFKVTSVIREEKASVATFQKWTEEQASACNDYLDQLDTNSDDAVFAAFWANVSDRHPATYGADTKVFFFFFWIQALSLTLFSFS